MNPLTKLYRGLRAEAAWLRHKPALLAMQRKGVVGSFDTVTVSDWYARNGFSGIAAALGGNASTAGIPVNADTAFQSTAIYACTKIISEDMGALPLFLYRRTPKGREQARDHRLFSILHDLVNPDTSAGEFVEALTAHAAIAKNGFAMIERSRNKRDVIWLRQLMPANVRLEQDSKGQTVYIVTNANGSEKTHGKQDIFHLKGFTLDGIGGDDMLQRARDAIGLTLAAQTFASNFFKNDMSVGLMLKRPLDAPGLGPPAVKKLKADFIAMYQGAHEPIVLQEGMTVDRLLPDPEKVSLVEQRKFQLEEVARLFRMPLHRLGHLERMTFNNVEQLGIDYVSYTLSPWVQRWRRAVHRCLLTRGEQIEGDLHAEHSVEALRRGDFAGQAEGFARFLEKGVHSINEVRAFLNLNKVEGGDAHFIQLNMQSVADAATGKVVDQGSKLVPVGGGNNG